jgi:hypothetical protein
MLKDNRIDYGKSLEKLMTDNANIYRYRGAKAERRFGGFVWANGFYSSQKNFEDAVDKTYGSLSNSIKK